MRGARPVPAFFTALTIFALLTTGCLTLRTARTLAPGETALRIQTSPMAPPPYLGGVSVGRGITDSGEVGLSFGFLSGALDEPAVDLEWFQRLDIPSLRLHTRLPPIDLAVGLGAGLYVIDPGQFLHTTQAASMQFEKFSPMLLHRFTLDLDGRTRQELLTGVELFSHQRLRLYFAGGSRDFWNRDQWVVVVGGALHMGGGR
jgi:hypothetical protein